MKYRIMHENDGKDWWWVEEDTAIGGFTRINGTMSDVSAADAKDEALKVLARRKREHLVEEFELSDEEAHAEAMEQNTPRGPSWPGGHRSATE